MHALRPDYKLDETHTVSVDQWDWEIIITKEQHNLNFLKEIINKLFSILKNAQEYIYKEYPILYESNAKDSIWFSLPDHIRFVHSEDLLADYPDLSPKERETAAVKKYGAIFLVQIYYIVLF